MDQAHLRLDWSGAEQEIKRALDLNPNSAAAHQLYGNYYLAMGQFADGIRGHERARQRVDRLVLRKERNARSSFDAFLKLRLTDEADEALVRDEGARYRREGWTSFWRHDLNRIDPRPPGSTQYFSALAYARIGDKENAFRILRREIELHTVWVVWINVDPELDTLRSDARFPQLVRITGR